MSNGWQDKDLGLMIRLLNPYSKDMIPTPAHVPTAEGSAQQAAPPQETSPQSDLGQYQVEIDNYEGAWDFKGNTHKITRALRITYRYRVKDGQGILATEHLLVGYAGGNGG